MVWSKIQDGAKTSDGSFIDQNLQELSLTYLHLLTAVQMSIYSRFI